LNQALRIIREIGAEKEKRLRLSQEGRYGFTRFQSGQDLPGTAHIRQNAVSAFFDGNVRFADLVYAEQVPGHAEEIQQFGQIKQLAIEILG
jgi:hypothetical protein